MAEKSKKRPISVSDATLDRFFKKSTRCAENESKPLPEPDNNVPQTAEERDAAVNGESEYVADVFLL